VGIAAALLYASGEISHGVGALCGRSLAWVHVVGAPAIIAVRLLETSTPNHAGVPYRVLQRHVPLQWYRRQNLHHNQGERGCMLQSTKNTGTAVNNHGLSIDEIGHNAPNKLRSLGGRHRDAAIRHWERDKLNIRGLAKRWFLLESQLINFVLFE